MGHSPWVRKESDTTERLSTVYTQRYDCFSEEKAEALYS